MFLYTIRRAKRSDLKDCAELCRSWCQNWFAGNKKLVRQHLKQRIKEGNVLVATDNARVVGYLCYGTVWTVIHLEDCTVKKEYRRAGIASALIQKCLATCKKAGFKKAMSECGTWNKKSYKLHVKNGFKRCGYMKKIWGNDDLYVFSKKLK